jgi:hypothetical protein
LPRPSRERAQKRSRASRAFASPITPRANPSLSVAQEEEFLGIYFEQLGKSLREARKPPLPPGYKWEDCAKGYDLAVLDLCADIHAREGAEGGSEYAVWKCGAVVDALERKVGGSTEPTLGQWKSIIDRDL